MRHAARAASEAEKTRRLVERSRAAILRARAVTITARLLMQNAAATLYENRLIRGLKR